MTERQTKVTDDLVLRLENSQMKLYEHLRAHNGPGKGNIFPSNMKPSAVKVTGKSLCHDMQKCCHFCQRHNDTHVFRSLGIAREKETPSVLNI